MNIPGNSYYLINNVYIYIVSFSNLVIINDSNINYYNFGPFYSIALLDNNYFTNNFPLFVTYENILLNENLLGQISTVPITTYDHSGNPVIKNNIIPTQNISDNKYVINSLLDNNYKNIVYYDISYISYQSSIENTVELIFYDPKVNATLLRPLIISIGNNTNYPTVNFTWTNNNKIYNNSFIMLNTIPYPTIGFCNLNINYSSQITSITTLQPSINIFSNTNYTSNVISFSDTTSLTYNKHFKWSLLINQKYPVYFWTYFTTSGVIYTTNSVSEPVYVNENNLNLFSLATNIKFNGSLPNIIINSNNLLKINNNIFYQKINRLLINKYYCNSLFTNNTNYFIKEINYHPTNKYIPQLYLLDKINITNFTESFIYLDNNSINILLEATYLIIQNNNYNYTQIIESNQNGIYIDTTNFNLDTNYSLSIYYSYSDLIFNKNNLSIICDNNFNYKIINYQYNDLTMNELILVDNILWSGKILLEENKMDFETKLIHNFNEKIFRDDRVENIVLPLRDGIMMLKKK